MLKELDLQIRRVDSELRASSRRAIRLEEKFGRERLMAEIPFPWSLRSTDDYVYTRNTNPLVVELTCLTAARPGKYRSRGITYHPNSQTPDVPFVCHFEFPLADRGIFFSKTKTAEVVVSPLEGEQNVLEIRADASPIVHVRGDYRVYVCRDFGCYSDEECPHTSFTVPFPKESRPLDPVGEFLRTQQLGTDIDQLNEVSKAFLLRLVLKNNFSTFTWDIDRQKDDYTVFEAVKRLGLVTVSSMVASYDLQHAGTGFKLQKYDPYLDMHIPDDIANDGLLALAAKARKSLGMVADYILLHNLKPKYLVGVTYEKLALITQRFGFRTFELSLPDQVRKQYEEIFNEQHIRGQKGCDMGRVLVVFQPTQEFLERFAA